MFNIGLSEIVVIFFIALLFLKPKDFIQIVKAIINTIKKIKIFIINMQSELEKINVLSDLDDYVKIDKKNK